MRLLAIVAVACFAVVPVPAAASSILFNGSATVQCIGESPSTDSFSHTTGTVASDSASMTRLCQELVEDDGPDEIELVSRSAGLNASIADNVLRWDGFANGKASQTDAGSRVNYVITDLLTITETGTFDIHMHISGSGSGTPANCFLYSFTGDVRLNGSQTLLAPVSITPCASTTDNVYSFFATAGTQVPIITRFQGRVGLTISDQVTFDSSQSGIVTITSADGGAFKAESTLSYAAVSAVPEPATIGLVAIGLGALRLRRRR
jgi:hypothetical protein